MENEIPVVALPKRLWNVVRFFFLAVRKGICKRKLLLDLSLLLKRGKLAGKAVLGNLILNHHSHHTDANAGIFSFLSAASRAARPGEYEFSCSNTPNHTFLLGHVGKRHPKRKHNNNKLKAQYDCIEEEMAAFNSALELMALNDAVEASSPLLPGLGFGRSPMVRQLRITDSPFPVLPGREEGDCHVDEAAEEFIKRFYSQLRRQSLTEG